MYGLFDRLWTIKRTTAFVLDPVAAAASLTGDRQPSEPSVLQFRVSGGTTNSGSITVVGTVDGAVGDQETLAFSAAGAKSTKKKFSAYTSITTAGFASEATVPTIEGKAIGSDGTDSKIRYNLATGWPGGLEMLRQGWSPGSGVGRQTGTQRIYIAHSDLWTLREGDLLQDEQTGERFRVEGLPLHQGKLSGSPFWELHTIRDQT